MRESSPEGSRVEPVGIVEAVAQGDDDARMVPPEQRGEAVQRGVGVPGRQELAAAGVGGAFLQVQVGDGEQAAGRPEHRAGGVQHQPFTGEMDRGGDHATTEVSRRNESGSCSRRLSFPDRLRRRRPDPVRGEWPLRRGVFDRIVADCPSEMCLRYDGKEVYRDSHALASGAERACDFQPSPGFATNTAATTLQIRIALHAHRTEVRRQPNAPFLPSHPRRTRNRAAGCLYRHRSRR